MPQPNRCQAEACDLQYCLGKNTYNPEKCEVQLRALYECCQQMYEEGDKQQVDLESTACPMPRVVKRWLEDHPVSKESS